MPKPLNIGIVANTAFNIYNFRLSLIEALKQEGHRVIAIAPKDEYVELLLQHNIEFVEITQLARKGTNPFHDLKLWNEFRKKYRQNKLDIVLQYTIKPNIYGTLAAKWNGIKSVCTVTGLGYTFLNKNIASNVAHRLYKWAFSYAHKILFQNKDDATLFINQHIVEKNKVELVPGSGIDTDKFYPDFCSPKMEDDLSTTRFLMIGRLLKDKGIYEYVQAAQQIKKQHPQVEFQLLGDIDFNNPTAIKRHELNAWIQNETIVYKGFTKDTRPFICEADCVVLPSYREGMPRVILESMAMAKPCITTNAPGCKDAIIDGETGWLCEVANTADLKSKMENFIQVSPLQKQKMGKQARKRAVEVFSIHEVNSQYVRIIEILCRN
ncbi:MAG TPA: glycosyltransferase family 4 protein [Chitinophagales bacterium]|jgi:glycosyltransferase involved in cell wall biosynthesis|nr:glycosyltransferase family 4 protein [Chitinophagales bacterium]MBP6155013.1 glycosyltransferase family 4 protein [Chitinophagales bacterium]HQV78372.1 glycosyltransferase family 4 protein [Chitinophagales bacterium]HQW79523.1 glycosyltransferase family 4 protein [Chitinophagales bacterium]HRB67908.1 glycosyltransferase family 4 protein [Chitinophagales bacterium]